MHELAIVQNMLDVALDKAKGVKAARIVKINVVLGELSEVTGESVQFYFDLLKKGTAAADAALDVRLVAGRLRCRDCLRESSPQESTPVCPFCHSPIVEILSGDECNVESIDVE